MVAELLAVQLLLMLLGPTALGGGVIGSSSWGNRRQIHTLLTSATLDLLGEQ